MSGGAKNLITHAKQKLDSLPESVKGKLNPVEAAQVIAYSGAYYREVNKQLRAGVMTEEQFKFAKSLNDALGKMPPYVGVTRRGTTLSNHEISLYKPGMIVEERGFMSSSKGTGFSGDVRFEIHGKTGRDIQKLSSHPGEAEVLFRAGTRFRVKSKVGTTITLEEVDYGR